MTQCTLGNGIIDQRNYDLQGRITEQTLTGTNSTILDRRHYDYDANGNIIARQLSSDNTPQTDNQYEYDPIDRLIHAATDNQPQHAYAYDLNHIANTVKPTTAIPQQTINISQTAIASA